MNSQDLNNIFEGTADAIRALLKTSDGVKPEDFNKEILKGVRENDIYFFETLEERDSSSINFNDGDVCIVSKDKYIQYDGARMGQATNMQKEWQFPESITLETAITSSYSDRFIVRTSTTNYIFLSLSSSSYTVKLGRSTIVATTIASYTSSDGITYTRTSEESSHIFDALPTVYSSMQTRAVFLPFILFLGADFVGIYKYNTDTWKNLNLGITLSSDDVLLDKKAYTSEGIITGTRDMSKYRDFYFYIQNEEPTSKTGLWCTYDENLTKPNLDNNYEIITRQPTLIKPTLVMECPLDMSINTFNSKSCNNVHVGNIINLNYNGVEIQKLHSVIVEDKMYLFKAYKDDTVTSDYFFEVDLNTYECTQLSMPNISYKHNSDIWETKFAYDGINLYVTVDDTADSSRYVHNLYYYNLTNKTWSNPVTLYSTTSYYYTHMLGMLAYNGVVYAGVGYRTTDPNSTLITTYDTSNGSKSNLFIDKASCSKEILYRINSIFYSEGCVFENLVYSIPPVGSKFQFDFSKLTSTNLIAACTGANINTTGSLGMLFNNYNSVLYVYSSDNMHGANLLENSKYNNVNLICPSGVDLVVLSYIINNTLYVLFDDGNVYSYDLSNIDFFSNNINICISSSGTECQLYAKNKLKVSDVIAFTKTYGKPNVVKKIYVGNGTSWNLIKENQ